MKRLVVTAITLALLAVPVVTGPASAAPTCAGKTATIVGTEGNDRLVGTSARDVIVAGGGKDLIYGRGGNDIICAGNGRDVVYGGDGKDRIFGQIGKDTLRGQAGYDILNGGAQKDACYKGADGGRKVNCESADLKVTVRASTETVVGKLGPTPTFFILWKVKNQGPKPAENVQVVLDWDEVNVSCRGIDDVSGTEKLGTLKPGEFRFEIHTQECAVPAGDPATVSLSAVASTSSPEAIEKNNSAAAAVEVIPEP